MTHSSSPTENHSQFKELFEQTLTRTAKAGEVVRGRVVHIGREYVTIDIGYKSEGQIPLREFLGLNGQLDVREGDDIDVLFEHVEDESGAIVLSKEKADMSRAWGQISQACEQNTSIQGTIVAKVKGGLIVDIGVKAFLPGSQVDLRPVRNLDDYVGKAFMFKIIKFNRFRGNIVVSRRQLLEEERATLKVQTLQNLREDQIIEGLVKNITDYGVFVDLGGVDGLLHVTDISWSRTENPATVFSIGDRIRVKVLKYDRDTQKVSLGYKQIKGDPWETAAEKYHVGTRLKGQVVSLTDYGAFVAVEDGVEGLIHVSEMSWTKRIKHPSELLSVGGAVESVVLALDLENRRLSLGLKQALPDPWQTLSEKYPVGTRVRGTIKNLTSFGAFVELEDGIDGLLHISDMSWDRKLKNPAELFEVGQGIEVAVLELDAGNHRLSLGYKQLTEDHWQERQQKYTAGTYVEGTVKEILDDAYLIQLEDEMQGVLRFAELTQDTSQASSWPTGQRVTAQIIHVDNRDRTIFLSVKAYEKTLEDGALRRYIQQQKEKGGSSLGEILASKGVSDLGAVAIGTKPVS